MKDKEAITDLIKETGLKYGVQIGHINQFRNEMLSLIESHTKPIHAIEVIDRAVEVVGKLESSDLYNGFNTSEGFDSARNKAIDSLEQLKQEYKA